MNLDFWIGVIAGLGASFIVLILAFAYDDWQFRRRNKRDEL